jgi:alpha-ribazole phosphatase
MNLILVRHTTLDIAKGICYGHSDIAPSNNFLQEASAVKEKLNGIEVAQVYSSPLKRCKMLAEKCGYSNIIEDQRLIELNFGDWELKPWNDIKGDYAEKWYKDYFNHPCPGGENFKDLSARIKSFIVEIKARSNGNVIAFTHSGPIRVFHHILNNTKKEDLFNLQIEYGGVYSLKI